MRIIGGKFRSRKLVTLEGLATRPTLDKTKQAIFNSLGNYIPDFVVLDVFGGSGALTLESISRGAKQAYIIDSSKDKYPSYNKNSFSDLIFELQEIVPIEQQLNKIKEEIKFANSTYEMNEYIKDTIRLKALIADKKAKRLGGK